ncbi:MAG: hypothetical protein WC718_13585 [Phycisphaerales bacterium]|jgi:hypothetical protein
MVLLAAQTENWSKLWEPAAQHAPLLAAAGLVAGFIVLVAGGKLVRGGLILAGLAAGAGLGFLLAPSIFTQPAMWGVSTGAIGAALGGVGGAILASFLFRTAATAASAASLAALGVLIASIAFAYSKHDTIVPPAAAAPAAQVWADAAAASLVHAAPIDPLAPPTLGQQVATGCKAFASATGELVQNLWNAATPDGRLYIAGGATLGVLVGLVMGVLSPSRAMATTTALAGAGVCVGCLAVLAPHVGVDAAGTDRMALWSFGALASLGVFVQWASLRKPRRAGTSPAPVPA